MMMIAYRGKEGCKSTRCTRPPKLQSKSCFGYHCGKCDQPSSLQGHDKCPILTAWPLGTRVVDALGAWLGAGTVIGIDVECPAGEPAYLMYTVRLDVSDPVAPGSGNTLYVGENRLWREGVPLRPKSKYEPGEVVYFNQHPFDQGVVQTKQYRGVLTSKDGHHKTANGRWYYRVDFGATTRSLMAEYQLHRDGEAFSEIPPDPEYRSEPATPRSLTQIARDIRAARGNVQETIELSVEIADLILGEDDE